MLSLLALVIPLAVAGAVSPVMLTEQTVLLAGRNGRRIATCYAVGAAGTLLVILSALVFFGRSIALPEEPRLSASLDIVLGCLLVLLAAVLRHRRPRTPKPHAAPRDRVLGPGPAVGFGIFSMATNFTTLAVMVPVAKEIAASTLDVLARLTVLAVVVAVSSAPAWLPLAMTAVAPNPTRRGLAALAHLIDTRGRLATVLLLAGIGLFLVGRGIVRVLGL